MKRSTDPVDFPETSFPQSVFDPEAFAQQLATGDMLNDCKQAIAATTGYLHQRFREGQDVAELLAMRARFMDGLLGALWQRFDWPAGEAALVAVGGYGRGELHPCSDIDIMVLVPEDHERLQPVIERFVTCLWDIGLQIGHSVRSVSDCVRKARQDISVLTNLMEARVLQGSAELMEAVHSGTAPDRMWSSSEFFHAKLEEQQQRHEKFAETEYNLEPNVKSSPGGLRDLQFISWVVARHFGIQHLEQLDDPRIFTTDDMLIFLRGREFLWRVRYALHMLTGREEDRLLFDHQRELAAMWGFEDDAKLAVEKFMQIYYRWVQALSQLNELLIQSFQQSILRNGQQDEIREINERFQVRNGFLEASADDVFRNRPGALLEAFLICGRSPDIEGIGARTTRLIRDHAYLIDDEFRDTAEHRRMFMDILRSPHRMTHQLRSMLRYGVLGAYLPELGQVMGQMQHDLFHTYTVDAHTLQVIQNMRRFLNPEYAERFPVSSRVARRLPRIELLYIAGLYHDIGKGRGGDHSELGARDAEVFCSNHGLSPRDTNLVAWLVRNHLLMSAVSQRKDISDPEVIQDFARHVQDENRLDYLFTLTVADINGTNPNLWNAWRGSLLRQLYTEAKRALRRGLEKPVDKQDWIRETREAAIDLLEYRGFTVEELEDIWRGRQEDYFLRERPEDIAWHTEAIGLHQNPDKPLVLTRSGTDSSVANATQVFIYARSRPHLFSTVCAELEYLDLSVHDARIYNAASGMSLETFHVLDSDGRSIAGDPARVQHITEHLKSALQDTENSPDIIQRRTPRQMRSFPVPTETQMYLDQIKHMTVLEVSSPDRPGLLARIARIFVDFGVLLQTAKIQTLGERVEDVFFITDRDQQPISDPETCAAIQRAIRRELDQQATDGSSC